MEQLRTEVDVKLVTEIDRWPRNTRCAGVGRCKKVNPVIATRHRSAPRSRATRSRQCVKIDKADYTVGCERGGCCDNAEETDRNRGRGRTQNNLGSRNVDCSGVEDIAGGVCDEGRTALNTADSGEDQGQTSGPNKTNRVALIPVVSMFGVVKITVDSTADRVGSFSISPRL